LCGRIVHLPGYGVSGAWNGKELAANECFIVDAIFLFLVFVVFTQVVGLNCGVAARNAAHYNSFTS
jgi:hypothetical protein